jgi:hypothetical protein
LVGVLSTGAVIVGRAVTLRVIIPPIWNSEQDKMDKILDNSDIDIHVKFASAQQAKHMFQYKNTKEKLYKTNAAIWYNKTCRQKHLTPNHISIKINGNNQQCRKMITAANQHQSSNHII